MRRGRCAPLLLLLALATLAPGSTTLAQSPASPPARGSTPLPTTPRMADDARWLAPADEFLRRLTRNEFEAASQAACSPAMTAGVLGGAWAGLVAQLGAFTALSDATVSADRDQHVVDVQARFERASVTLRVVLDANARVSGFWVRPPKSIAPPAYAAPAYVQRDRFVEHEVAVGQGAGALPGTLTLPAGDARVPIVVLVHGSGPSDRDARLDAQYPFRDLAWGLASRGVGVLRYDKRSHANVASLMDAPITVEREVIVDALAALAAAREHPRSAGVVLAGHSLGGMLAPEIAARDGRVAAVVLLAGGTRPFAETVEEQLRYLASLPPSAGGGLDSAQLAAILPTLQSLRARTMPPESPIFGAPASYVYDLDTHDPLAAARTLRVPVLAVHGGRDYHVTAVDAARWREALAGNACARVTTYPALNHLLMPGTGRATPAEYRGAANHVDAALVSDLAAWIHESVPAR